VFAETLKPNVPLPVPGEPLVMVTQDALGVAVHEHDGSDVVTPRLSDTAPDAYDRDEDASVTVHVGGGGVDDDSGNFVLSFRRAPGEVLK